MKKQLFIFLLIVAGLAACQPFLYLPINSENNKNLNSLLTLKIGDNTLYLQDFVMNPAEVDSVTSSSTKLICQIGNNKITAKLKVLPEMEHFVNVYLWQKGVPFSVPCRKTDRINYTFTFNPQGKSYTKVQLVGQMNDWTAARTPELKLNDRGLYEVTLNLSPGTYLYQMSLDGVQNHDTNNPDKVDNGYGKFNSILQVTGQGDQYPVLFTDKFNRSGITLSVQKKFKEAFVYWQNYRLPAKQVKTEEGKITFNIPAEAKRADRSYIRVWASNEFGVSNDLLIPLHQGKVLTDSKEITRSDKQAQIIYFMLVDRFKDGDKTNNHPMNRPDVNPKVDYWGGDLAGIQQEIDNGYFEKLGANTLWISPLNQNPTTPYGYSALAKTKFSGYHGYWPVSSSKVDFRFGTNEEFKDLVTDAHQKNINILLDYVAHHVHIEHPFYKQHPEWTTPLYLPDGTLNTERWDDQRLTTWFDTFMPTLDLSNPKVVDMMTDSAMYWLKEFNLDGFRHDATKHITEQFWRELTLKIKKQNAGDKLYQIGETYGSPELISSYLTTGMLDGQFDFNVYDIANTTFAGVGGSNLQQVQAILNSSLYTYGSHNLMGNISGNHDKPRFMALASGDLKFGEDAKAAGWQREIGITDSTAYDKLFLMHTFNMTIPGIPVVFYGDEIGLTGANDPDCRRMMKFDGWNNREAGLWKKVATLAHLRKDNPVLIYGEFINILPGKDYWAYARKYFDKNAIVFINNSSKPKTFELILPAELNTEGLRSTFNTKFSLFGRNMKIQLPPYSAEILL
ncbi:MAG: alpha-amylase family glycosyl hydrolase [Bacteroidota bacterium]|nr:alpha-amylase family glycosyl hydrolase [Bacteroidota bacterium]